MALSVTYRLAKETDVSLVAGLRAAGEAGGASEERMAQYLAGEHHPQKALAPRAMYLAEASERPVGYIAGHLTKRYNCTGELQWIYVQQDHRGMGVADELLHLLAGWFVRQNATRVCVDVGDPSGRRFCEKHGAQVFNPYWMIWPDIGVVLDRKE